ncbi:MAG: redoxin domain-containing protein [bacterium]|nr:redoxin domain-containing protein [bacterium]
MKRTLLVGLAAVMVMTCGLVNATAGDGSASDFTLEDTNGKEVSLSDFEGKVVVLEWVNPDCPYVKRHYEAGTMVDLANKYAGRDVVWLAVNSTNYMDAATSEKFRGGHDVPYPFLVDQPGTVGKSYLAATTPHMFVIDREGSVVYQGAIDDDPRGKKADEAVNYVAKALDELLAGKAVATSETKPYGCSVKYPK